MIRIISIVKSWVSAARAFNLWSIYFYWACLMLRWFICYYAYLTIPHYLTTARSTSQHTSPHLSVTVSVFIHEKLSNENKRTSEHHNWLIIPWHCWLVVAVRCQCWDTGTMTIYQWQECHYRCYHQQHTGPIHTSITMTQSRVYIQMNILFPFVCSPRDVILWYVM